MKVLVTAFKPFNNQTINYSSEVLKYIENVDKLIVDVIYDECYLEVNRQVRLEEYDLIVALGEARMRKELTLEGRAKNLSSCSLKDNSGVLKENEIINNSFKEYLETKVLVEKCMEEVKLSYDAGTFVCNNLYFHLLEHHMNKAIFIHIPNCYDCEEEYQKYAKKINQIINKLVLTHECKI